MKMIGVERERMRRLDQSRRFDAIGPRHSDIEQDDREILLEQQPKRFRRRIARTMRCPSGVEHGLERVQVLRLVVDDEDLSSPWSAQFRASRRRWRSIRSRCGREGGAAQS